MSNKYIVVNATALSSGGALSILSQFVQNIPQDDYQWLIFVPESVGLHSSNPNIRIERIGGVKSMFKRLWWDAFGLSRWIKEHGIEPIAQVSLQNTGFRVGKKVPAFIYFHQALSLAQQTWNPFKAEERVCWIYKHLYAAIVKFFLTKDTIVYVQLEHIKREFSRRFHHSMDKIEVYTPTVTTPVATSRNEEEAESDTLKLFYPAANYSYKNHRVIVDALKFIDVPVEISFTIESSSDKDDKGVDKRLHYMGSLPYSRVCEMYHHYDALLFPSYIETFGLPLIEGALTGIPIICADLPYAREVLEDYEGVKFVDPYNARAWADAITSLKRKQRFTPFDISRKAGWTDLFKSIINYLSVEQAVK